MKIITALILLTSSLFAQNYYVNALTGINSLKQPGDISHPWKTISYAAERIRAGPANIYVADGMYDLSLGEVFPISIYPNINIIGSSNSIISGKNEDTRIPIYLSLPTPPIISLRLFVQRPGFTNSSSIINNFLIQNAQEIYTSDLAPPGGFNSEQKIIFINCRFLNASRALISMVMDTCLEIFNCYFENMTSGAVWVGPTRFQHKIISCRFYKNAMGLNMANAKNVVIDKCFFEKNGNAILAGAIFVRTSNNIIIRNSIFNNNIIGINTNAIFPTSMIEMYVINCTFKKNDIGMISSWDYNGLMGITSQIIANCLLYRSTLYDLINIESTELFNCLFESANTPSTPPYRIPNPNLFTDPGINQDYRLNDDSILIDAGWNNQYIGDNDYYGNRRDNGYVDIGAVEYNQFLTYDRTPVSIFLHVRRIDNNQPLIWAASLFDWGHISLDDRNVYLTCDDLFWNTVTLTTNHDISVQIPPVLNGTRVLFGYVTINPGRSAWIETVSNIIEVIL